MVGVRPDSEERLVARARRGDPDACARLVELHADIAFRTAWLITRSSADAEEAAQDGFTKAFRALGRFRRGAAFRPWLLAIVANEARNRRVAAGRRERLLARAAAEPATLAAGPEAAVLATERRQELLDAIGRLPEPDRLVLACRYLLELDEAESAAALGVRRGTVKSRTSRALARLREEVGDA